MEKILRQVAQSYDIDIKEGIEGRNRYDNLNEEVRKSKLFESFLKMVKDNELCGSDNKEIIDYLSFKKNDKFIDLGCSLNYFFKGYIDLPIIYYGIDISQETIGLLDRLKLKRQCSHCYFECGSMHQTPYPNDFFDVGANIGSLEYFPKAFVKKAVMEFFRILKPNARFVLDIPNLGSKEANITSLIEESLSRPDLFDMEIIEFEEYIKEFFLILRKDKKGPMLLYYLVKKA